MPPMRTHLLTLLSLFSLLVAPTWATPVVVELFTSKYCPNCPAAEKKLHGLAAADTGMVILQQHVDYWDQGTRKDPFGLADATQRQYDYSNTIGRRPGEVFTPMPLLNGTFVAEPPLWMNWDTAYAEAQKGPQPAALALKLTPDGGLEAALPESLGADSDAWVMGVEPIAGHANILRVRAIVQARTAKGRATLAKALLPATPQWVLLVQKPSNGALLGFGQLKN